jgi:glycosyltransferase involved in cell wall biosynthesis
MDRLKILYISTTSRVGGAEESLLTLFKALPKEEVELFLACPLPEPEGDPVAACELRTRAAALGVNIIELPLRRLKRTLNPFNLLEIRSHLGKCRREIADIVNRRGISLIHANSPTAALHADGAPVACHLRDLTLPPLAAREIRKRCRIVIATSHTVAAFARAKVGEIVRRIPNGVDADLFAPGATYDSTEIFLRHKTPADEKPYILMVSHLIPWKKHDLFISCMARVRAGNAGVRGIIAGADLFSDHGEHVASLKKQAEEAGLKYALEWRDNVPVTDMPRLVSGALLLLHPTPGEPFGRAVLEAMSCATPVVAVNSGGPAELLADGGGVLVAPDDVGAMAKAVNEYLENPRKARQDGQRAREIVLQKYTHRQHAETMLELYRELT